MKVAFVCGRFEPIHKGHQLLIDEAYKLQKDVAILICSSQESRTSHNPLSFEERKELIKKIYPKAIIIPVPDMGIGNNEGWGDFLLSVLKEYNCEPKFFVTGEEERRESWFRKEILKKMKIIKISRSKIVISATELREDIRNNNLEKIKEFIPQEIIEDIINLKEVFVESEKETSTKSI